MLIVRAEYRHKEDEEDSNRVGRSDECDNDPQNPESSKDSE